MTLSIIIPVLDEAANIAKLLNQLAPARRNGHEIIVVDGGSQDGTREIAATLCNHLIISPPGRALQMNSGAARARGEVILFLHADCTLPEGAPELVLQALSRHKGRWGRFDVCLSGKRLVFRVIESLMNWRSRWSGIATGDQGIFVERDLFVSSGGFPAIPLMEDIALSVRLKRTSAPICLRPPITVSSRRWEKDGAWQTIWLMWRLRYAYWRGADPATLARIYYPRATHG